MRLRRCSVALATVARWRWRIFGDAPRDRGGGRSNTCCGSSRSSAGDRGGHRRHGGHGALSDRSTGRQAALRRAGEREGGEIHRAAIGVDRTSTSVGRSASSCLPSTNGSSQSGARTPSYTGAVRPDRPHPRYTGLVPRATHLTTQRDLVAAGTSALCVHNARLVFLRTQSFTDLRAVVKGGGCGASLHWWQALTMGERPRTLGGAGCLNRLRPQRGWVALAVLCLEERRKHAPLRAR